MPSCAARRCPPRTRATLRRTRPTSCCACLRALKKVLTADDDMLSAIYVKAKAWDHNQVSMSTEDLRRAVRPEGRPAHVAGRWPAKKRRSRTGSELKDWIYYDSAEEFGYDHESPPAAWQISDEALLYTPRSGAPEAPDQGQVAAATARGGSGRRRDGDHLPVCGQARRSVRLRCRRRRGSERRNRRSWSGTGRRGQAFGQIADQCGGAQDRAGAPALRQGRGLGKQAAAEMSRVWAWPSRSSARAVISRAEHRCHLRQGAGAEVDFHARVLRGGWERYKRLQVVG